MYEFEFVNIYTNEIWIAFGRNPIKALEKDGLNPNNWKLIYDKYID